jgi:hypothetical protein
MTRRVCERTKERDLITGAKQFQRPVVVTIAGSRVVCVAIDKVVGPCHPGVGTKASDIVLTTNVRGLCQPDVSMAMERLCLVVPYLDVVDPQEIRTIHGQRISAPDEPRRVTLGS